MGIKWAYFDNWSTTTIMILCPSKLSKDSLKSIGISVYTFKGLEVIITSQLDECFQMCFVDKYRILWWIFWYHGHSSFLPNRTPFCFDVVSYDTHNGLLEDCCVTTWGFDSLYQQNSWYITCLCRIISHPSRYIFASPELHVLIST